jgi:hypothetical protein
MRRIVCAAALTLAAASTAAAQAPPPGAIQLVPNKAGKPSELRVDLGSGTLPASGEVPSSVVLASTRGFRFDRRARAATCSGGPAESFSCPERSRIGSGSAEFVVRGPLLPPEGLADTATIDVFLAPPPVSGDLYGVEVQVNEQRFGMRGRSVGRLVPLPSGPFGSELRFESVGGALEPPPGYTVELKRLQLSAGAKRTVRKTKVVRRNGRRKRVRRRVTYHLIRNPSSCPGAWPYEVRLGFASGEERRPGEVACEA